MFYSNYSAISHGNLLFQQMTLIWPFKVTKSQTDYAIRSATYDLLLVFYSNYSAISYGNPVFQQMTLIWPFKVTKGQTDYAFRSATYDLLLVFYSNYSAISYGNHVFQQMTLIWPFKVTKGQTDYSIESATYDFLLTFYSNYSAISLRLRDIRRQTSEDLAGNPTFDLLKVIELNWFLVSLDHLLALFNALHMRYVALISVLPFAFYIYLFSKNSRNIKMCLK